MKRVLSLLLSLALISTLAACSGGSSSGAMGSDSSTEESSESTESENPSSGEEEQTTPVSQPGEESITELTLVISTTASNPTARSIIPVSFSFSKDVSGFDESDITLSSGSITDFSGSGSAYTANLNFDLNGTYSLVVDTASVSDSASGANQNSAASFEISYSSEKPSVNLSSSSVTDGGLAGEQSIDFNVLFSEKVTGFTQDDIIVSNATISSFNGSDESYSFTATPVSDGIVTFNIPADAATNSAGSGNTALSDIFNYTSDSGTVTLSITSTSGNSGIITNDESVVLQISFSEKMDGTNLFESTDIICVNGTPQNFVNTASDKQNYVVEILPDSEGEVSITIPEGSANTALPSGKESAGGSFTFTSDRTAPASVNFQLQEITSKDTISSNGFANQAMLLDLLTDYSSDTGSALNMAFTKDNGTSWQSYTPGATFITGDDIYDGINIRVTDAAGNLTSGTMILNVTLDTVKPATPEVTITTGDPVTSINNDGNGLDFTVSNAGAEALAYTYTIASSGGGASSTVNGTFDFSGEFSVSGHDLSSVKDGVLRIEITQTDLAGNTSIIGSSEGAGFDQITLDTIAVNEPDFTLDVDPSNETDYSFDIVGEVGSTYSFTISSSEGGTPITGSGTFGDGINDDYDHVEHITGLNLENLGDGYLVLELTITDPLSHTSTTYTVVEKSALIASTDTADFSGEAAAVDFDMSNHSTQSVPTAGQVKFDTTDLIGSDFDDNIRFSALEDGETFTINGGTGYNTMDLSNYLSDDVTIHAGQTGVDIGTLTVDLGNGESAVINYTNFKHFVFDTNNFSGSPHGVHLDTSSGSGGNAMWEVTGSSFLIDSPNNGGYKAGIAEYAGTLDINYQLDVTFTPIDSSTRTGATNNGSYKNALIIFDYLDDDNYKFARAYALANKYELGEVISGSTISRATLNETIDENSSNPLRVKATGSEGKTAEVWSYNSSYVYEMKKSYTYGDKLNNGRFGVSNINAITHFSLDMTPSNWAPYCKKYYKTVSHTAGLSKTYTLNLIADASDYEGSTLTLESVTREGSADLGSLTVNNAAGTVTYRIPGPGFYGKEKFFYTLSDGTNTTVAEITFDVVP